VKIVRASVMNPTGTEGNAAGPVATPSTGATEISVIRQRQRAGGVGPDHHHDREEILVPLAGEIAVHAGGERHAISPGDAAILPASVVHRVETIGNTPAEWLLVAPTGIRFFGVDGLSVTPLWAE